MRAALPFLALAGVVVITIVCIAGDVASMRWAVMNAMRRRLLVQDIDTRVGELADNLAAIVGSAVSGGFPENCSQAEFLSFVLQEMRESVDVSISSKYMCQCTWSVQNESDSQAISYVVVLHLVVLVPEEEIEVRSAKSYYLQIPIRRES